MTALSAAMEVCNSLSDHMSFGRAESIRRRAGEVLDFSLDILAEQRPEPAVAAGARRIRSDGLLFDPVVRDALEIGLRELKQGQLADESEVFGTLARIGGQREPGVLREVPLPVLQLAGQGVGQAEGVQVWSPAAAAPGASARFAELCAEQLNREGIEARTVDSRREDVELLLRSAELARSLLGGLAVGLFSHVRVVVLVAGRSVFRSASDRGAPGTVFLRLVPGDQPLTVAELIVHESVHHRLYDLYSSRSILSAGYQDRAAEPIVAHWNRPSPFDTNLWSPDRALAAFHVYVHLAALFIRAAQERAHPRSPLLPVLPVGALPRARQSCDRARYLGEQLRARSADLGPDGLHLVEWLLDNLSRLETALPETAFLETALPETALPETTAAEG
ncbi:hypothetical protein [Kitasatospora sp. GP82]|uniref:hypothetical protein n=1 Tax=Kitasatospora sp. GP82 TaxID=3035089 RepID=UPI0024756FBD|nr:hypothetical protein [Kitasatospora sp. GP82]MDH6126853.1 hypothetical protein [Kitasatospora sp. GP82]